MNLTSFLGGVAQLGERLLCTQEAIGSSPFTSTILVDLLNCQWSVCRKKRLIDNLTT